MRTAFKDAGIRGKAALILASWFSVGLVPFAPGTAGTLAGMPLVLFTGCLETPEAALFDLVFIAVSVWTADLSSRILQKDDPSVVVIDEVAGFLLTLFLVPLNLGNVCLGFLLFRLFDVLKPFPIKKLENLRGGLGIVADDLLAGVYANLSLRLLIFFL